MRLPMIALLALGACTSQQPAGDRNVVQEVTNITDDASPAPLEKRPIASGKEKAAPVATADNRTEARFRCMDGVRIVARFDAGKGSAMLVRAGQTIILQQQPMASGIRYSDGKTVFQGKGDNMSFEAPGQPPIACTVIR